jgi:hypothetical protein
MAGVLATLDPGSQPRIRSEVISHRRHHPERNGIFGKTVFIDNPRDRVRVHMDACTWSRRRCSSAIGAAGLPPFT